ncbi:MAG: hypothetical protein ACRC33_13540 [Gemmataceae bacterium]
MPSPAQPSTAAHSARVAHTKPCCCQTSGPCSPHTKPITNPAINAIGIGSIRTAPATRATAPRASRSDPRATRPVASAAMP